MDSRLMHPGKYLKAADFPSAQLWTIAGLQEEEVKNQQTGRAENKFVLYFAEDDRGLILNVTNTSALQEYLGFETDDWMSKKVVVFQDRVDFAGKKVDAIRLREPKRPPVKMKTMVPVKQPTENPAEDMNDDIPF